MGGTTTVRWSGLHDAEAVEAWNSLQGTGFGDSVFGESVYLQAVAAGAGLEVDQVVVMSGERPAAAARIPIRRRLGIRRAVIPPLTAYSAVRLETGIKESQIHDRSSVLEVLLDAIEQKFDAAALHLPPQVQDTRVFTWRGWTVRPLYTYGIRLDASHDPLDAWSESARRIARQQSAEYAVETGDADTQAALVTESYLRNGRKPPLGRNRLARAVGTLTEAGTTTVLAARNIASGEIEASLTVLRSGSRAYYWAAGSKPGPSMTVLIAALLPRLATDGVGYFDFIGANTASIAEFKRRFGGRLTTYFRAVWRSGMIGRILGDR